MKVILLKDVPGTGKAGTVCEVKEGHARNYLIPRGLAIQASGGALRALEARREADQRRVHRQHAETEAQVHRLAGLVLEIRSRAGAGGKLFGSVTSQQIADALAARGFPVTRRQIEMEEAIRTEGFYRIPIRIRPGVLVHVDLNVVGTVGTK